MLIIPTFLLSIFASGLPRKWLILPIASVIFSLIGTQQAFKHTRRDTRNFRFERKLAKKIYECTDCRFLVIPRKGMGTRDRHDGCEVLQGVSHLMHPKDFSCKLWMDNIDKSKFTHQAKWIDRKKGYQLTSIDYLE